MSPDIIQSGTMTAGREFISICKEIIINIIIIEGIPVIKH